MLRESLTNDYHLFSMPKKERAAAQSGSSFFIYLSIISCRCTAGSVLPVQQSSYSVHPTYFPGFQSSWPWRPRRRHTAALTDLKAQAGIEHVFPVAEVRTDAEHRVFIRR